MTRIDTNTKVFSRNLRRGMTDAERLLWRHLKLRQMEGAKFRRQYPIAGYIVDFVCIDRSTIVEIDGGQHALITAYDDARTQALQAYGYRVLRFWNDEVLRDIEAVKASIWSALSQFPSSGIAQPPSQPSP